MAQLELIAASPAALKGERVANDYYPTDDKITLGLKNLLIAEGLYTEAQRVFCPCAGDGAMSRHFPGAITNEPYWSGDLKPHYRMDALEPGLWDSVGRCDWTIENPPYGDHFPEQLLGLAWGHSSVGVALHLRLTWQEGCESRRELIAQLWDHLRFIQSINPRQPFRRNTRGTDSTTTAWYVFVKAWSWEASGITNPFQYLLDWK